MKTSNVVSAVVVGQAKVAKSKGSKVVIDPSVFADDSVVGMVTVEEVEAKPKREKKPVVEKVDKRAIKAEVLRLTLEKINEIVQAQPLAKAQYLLDNGIENAPKLSSKSFDLFVLLRENFGFTSIIHYMQRYKNQKVHWAELLRIKDVYFTTPVVA